MKEGKIARKYIKNLHEKEEKIFLTNLMGII